MRKIVFVLGSMLSGGAERVISILSRDYAQKGWETHICTLLFDGVEYELDPSTKLHAFTGNSDSRIRRLPYWLRSIRRLIKEVDPDVVVSFAARINILVMLACLGLKKRIVVSERNDPQHDGRGWMTRFLTGLLYPHAKSVVFQTKRAQKQFSERIQRNSKVLPNPINVAAMAGETDRTRIVSVGSFKPQKNHRLLIEAMADVVRVHPEMKLTIYGDGALRKDMEILIRENDLQGNVFLPGKSSDVHECIRDASMFVLSSDYEGLSNALLEAMMMGLPCISTRCAGSDEYITNGKNGLLVPVGEKEALAAAMLSYIEDDSLRKTCGENAKLVRERVGSSVVLQQWHEVIGDNDE